MDGCNVLWLVASLSQRHVSPIRPSKALKGAPTKKKPVKEKSEPKKKVAIAIGIFFIMKDPKQDINEEEENDE